LIVSWYFANQGQKQQVFLPAITGYLGRMQTEKTSLAVMKALGLDLTAKIHT
jgi:hypothetical protein